MNEGGKSERPFGLGLIVGKFSPLHRGHEWLVDQAAVQCDRLLILSYANPEFDRCAAPARRLWLAKQFPEHETLVIDTAWLEQACLDRSHVPISATQIRRNPHEHRQWMAPDVASAFVHRIVLLGGESSGKTTLTAALADHFKTIWVHEYGRELWEQQQGILSEEDLLKIGHEQIRREEQALRSANYYLFGDTSPLTTLGYSLWIFGHVGPALAKLATRTYDAIILCKPDFPFVQDGSRREEAFRDQQHAWYQERLATLRYPVLEASGTVSERVSSVALWLTGLNLR
jgi:HTH-type transcriptional regulator, transcriptional repressor of NAD biosynthesis genes